jgi:hypothetical protein
VGKITIAWLFTFSSQKMLNPLYIEIPGIRSEFKRAVGGLKLILSQVIMRKCETKEGIDDENE